MYYVYILLKRKGSVGWVVDSIQSYENNTSFQWFPLKFPQSLWNFLSNSRKFTTTKKKERDNSSIQQDTYWPVKYYI